MRYLPYKFTAKEQDEETGFYYYGARYLDAKYSRWLSTDPAVSDYIPQAPVNDEAKKHNQSLPGMGGVFNVVNLQLYHYAGNNPVKYTDPDGREEDITPTIFNQQQWKGIIGDKKFWEKACAATAILNIVSEVYTKESGKSLTFEQGIELMQAAIDSGNIRFENAFVDDWEGAANEMGRKANLVGTFIKNEKNPQYTIYAFPMKTMPSLPRHFVNAIDNCNYIDTWDGKHKELPTGSSMFILKPSSGRYNMMFIAFPTAESLQHGRPIRGFDYLSDSKRLYLH